MHTMYGIKNCETVKKARKWLEENQIEYDFYDYKSQGVEEKKLKSWAKELGWETLLNTKGMTWRKLPDEAKQNLTEAKAIQLMMEHPSVIKRPIVDTGKIRIVGFAAGEYEKLK